MTLELTLELIRAENGGDPFAFQFTPQDYLLRQPDGAYSNATFDWDDQVLADLAELTKPAADRVLIQRLGDTLRSFLERLQWKVYERQLEDEVAAGRPVHLTFRFAAAELASLPWECLTLRASGVPLGRLPGCVIQYEWVGTRTTPPRPSPPPEGGRLLFAWSTAGGDVRADEHRDAIVRACARGHYSFDPHRNVLEKVSLRRLVAELEASAEPIGALHILCHGTRASPGSYGLQWDEVVDAGTLAAVLSPHASRIRLVVLCACQSAHPGQLDNHLGSIAVALHRVGIPAVITSRLPLSVDGSLQLTETLYTALLERPASLQQALSEARRRLAQSAKYLDWASVQLFARVADGPDLRPFIFRPYRGLLAFQREHSRFFFGREALQQELVNRVQQAAAGRFPRFQVVAGASGAGKSSLVLAGLVPTLPPAGWDVLVMRPGEQRGRSPAAVLRSRLASLWRSATETSETVTPADVLGEAEQLRHARPDRQLLLVVDQLEEVFTQVNSLVARQSFLVALWQLTQDSGLGIAVVTTLRVDYFERCGEVAVSQGGGRFDELVYSEAHRLFVPQLGPQQLQAAIERPAHTMGLELDKGLSSLLQEQLGQEPGALPLLEYALDLLWERREGQQLTHSAYQAMGGVTGALTQTAQRLYDELSVEEQRQARRLLVALVDFGTDTSPNTRRRVWLEQVQPSGEEARNAFAAAIERLVAQRLLVRGQEVAGSVATSGVWIEVAHEALIRKWEQLGTWVKEDREHVSQLREIQGWAEAWLAHRNHPDGGNSYLLTGDKLGYARQLQEKYKADLPRQSNEFIARSTEVAEAAKAQEQERQRSLRRALRNARISLFGVGIALVTVAGIALYARNQAAYARKLATRAQEQQRRAEDFAKQIAAKDVGRDDPTMGLLVLRETRDTNTDFAWPAMAIELLQQPVAQAILIGHKGGVRAAAFSPDGSRIVTASEDGTARIWSADGSASPIVLKGHSDTVYAAAFSPDGARVVTASHDGTARVWRADGSTEPIVLIGHSAFVSAAAFSPDGVRVVTASNDGTARIWRADGAAPPIVLKGHSAAVNVAAFSPDGSRVLTASSDGTARIWSTDNSAAPIVLKGHSGLIRAAAFSPDGSRVVTTSDDGTARIWRAHGSVAPIILKGHSAFLFAAAFSPDGSRVVIGLSDGTARIWRTDGSADPIILKGHSGWIRSAVFSPDGSRVVTSSSDGTARIWRADGSADPIVLKGHSGWVRAASFSPDGSRVVTASADGTARLWRTDGSADPIVLKGHSGGTNAASFSPDGSRLVTASADGTARLWRADGSAGPVVLKGHSDAVYAAAFSPDGARVVTASHDGTARVWREDGSAAPIILKGHSGPIYAAAFSPDGTRVVTASNDGTARIWRADGAAPPVVLKGHSGSVNAAAFSPDGSRVLTASSDGTARIWSANNSAALIVLKGHSGWIRAAAFSPDGSRVVTASDDGTARIWRADGSAAPIVLKGHAALLFEGAFSPDGSRVVTTSMDGTARIWRADGSAAPIVLKGHSLSVSAVAFSPDGSRVVTASDDGTARVWRVDGSAAPIILKAHSDLVNAAAFSPDGSRVVTASKDGTARIWRVGTETLRARMYEVTTACLTAPQRELYLGEPSEQSQAGYAQCERSSGRPPTVPIAPHRL